MSGAIYIAGGTAWRCTACMKLTMLGEDGRQYCHQPERGHACPLEPFPLDLLPSEPTKPSFWQRLRKRLW